MNLEELKNQWAAQQVQSKNLHVKSIAYHLKNKTDNKMDKLIQSNRFILFVFGLEILLLVAVLMGNPFDFHLVWQYAPFIQLLGFILVGFVRTGLSIKRIRSLTSHEAVGEYLKKAIHELKATQKANQWFRLSFLAAGIGTLFSFIPHLTESRSFTSALPFIVGMVALSWGLYWLFEKSGWIKDSTTKKLESDYAEWLSLEQEL
ncbi:hypothetical protein [Jiulongibacter sp. NS-SX5]|uniref:hypothetical protein n=1 Tax=Jiulongibacter sp. NS-SX5 TaxID=3463854 RepID=UPI00405899B1